jgi:hypothetical protein
LRRTTWEDGGLLAYVFWHRPRPGVPEAEYDHWLEAFHARLAGPAPEGFRGSRTLRVPELPWLTGGGYEDWYLVDGFGDLEALNAGAVDGHRGDEHAQLAAAAAWGTAGIYRLVAGTAFASSGWAGWFAKADGVTYPGLVTAGQRLVDLGHASAVWQRQLVLGPAPEFLVEAAGPSELPGAHLVAGGTRASSSVIPGRTTP